MKVKELIRQLKQTNENNEVRLISQKGKQDYSKHLYLSFDDVGDVLIYEVEK